MANRVSKINDVLKALAGINWGQQKETLLLTYKTLRRSIANYDVPVWSKNLHDTILEKIQRTQNEALIIITGSHKMSSVDHLHSETKLLLVKDHLESLSAQCLVHCVDTKHVCHRIITMDHPPREMKETHFTRHNQAVHTSCVNTAIDNMTNNRVLNYRPPPINYEETYVRRRQRATLSPLHSGH